MTSTTSPQRIAEAFDPSGTPAYTMTDEEFASYQLSRCCTGRGEIDLEDPLIIRESFFAPDDFLLHLCTAEHTEFLEFWSVRYDSHILYRILDGRCRLFHHDGRFEEFSSRREMIDRKLFGKRHGSKSL